MYINIYVCIYAHIYMFLQIQTKPNRKNRIHSLLSLCKTLIKVYFSRIDMKYSVTNIVVFFNSQKNRVGNVIR